MIGTGEGGREKRKEQIDSNAVRLQNIGLADIPEASDVATSSSAGQEANMSSQRGTKAAGGLICPLLDADAAARGREGVHRSSSGVASPPPTPPTDAIFIADSSDADRIRRAPKEPRALPASDDEHVVVEACFHL